MNFRYLYCRRKRNVRGIKKKASHKDSDDSDDGPGRGLKKVKFICEIKADEFGFFCYPIRAPPSEI